MNKKIQQKKKSKKDRKNNENDDFLQIYAREMETKLSSQKKNY